MIRSTTLRPGAGAALRSQPFVLLRPQLEVRVPKAPRPIACKNHRDSTSLQTVNPTAAVIAAVAMLISPLEVQAAPALAAVPSTLSQPQEVTSRNLDERGISINLDAQPPPINPTNKAAAASAAHPALPTTDDGVDTGSARSSGSTTSPVGGATQGLLSDARAGSITLNQVLTTTSQLALQLLEVVVRVAAFIIKYTLKAFIWLVKLIGQWAAAG